MDRWGLCMTNIGFMIDERMVYPQYIPCLLSRFFWLAAFGWLNWILDRMERDRPHKLLENVVFLQKTCQKIIMFQKDNCSISFDRQQLMQDV